MVTTYQNNAQKDAKLVKCNNKIYTMTINVIRYISC